MRSQCNRLRATGHGFSLVELAVVMTIVAFLLGSLMYTLSAQTENRSFEDTRRRLDQARELVLAFAVVNGRLPCPARNAATASPVTVAGDEVVTTATGSIAASPLGLALGMEFLAPDHRTVGVAQTHRKHVLFTKIHVAEVLVLAAAR